jgi:hypothetical protein
LDRVRVKGKKDTVSVIEVIDGQPDFIIELFSQTKPDFERGVHAYIMHDLIKAKEYFLKVHTNNPTTKPLVFIYKGLTIFLQMEFLLNGKALLITIQNKFYLFSSKHLFMRERQSNFVIPILKSKF